MDKREELRRKLERIEREETAKQERPPEQSEVSAPSTEAASASPPPAPSLTPEQVQEITRSEVEKALREERAARLEESASERARNDARLDELSQGLTDTNERLMETDERVTNLREDTRNSLLPMAEEIAELKSEQNSRALPPVPEPRNVTPRPTPRPTTWPTPSMYPPRLQQTEPEMPTGTLERTSYQPPRTQIESGPPMSARTYEPEEPPPLFFTIVQALMVITVLILAVSVVVAILVWLWSHPWVLLAALIFLVWVAAVCLSWAMDMKPHSIMIFTVGAMAIALGALGYTAYQSWVERKPDVQMLGR